MAPIRRIPIDVKYKKVTVRGKVYLVPDFGEARNRLRKKVAKL
mgnify:CR=1 FL=1